MVGEVAVRLIPYAGPHAWQPVLSRVDGKLITGRHLFLEGCGRQNLPGGDYGTLCNLTRRLANISDDTVLFPGHMYSAEPSAPMG